MAESDNDPSANGNDHRGGGVRLPPHAPGSTRRGGGGLTTSKFLSTLWRLSLGVLGGYALMQELERFDDDPSSDAHDDRGPIVLGLAGMALLSALSGLIGGGSTSGDKTSYGGDYDADDRAKGGGTGGPSLLTTLVLLSIGASGGYVASNALLLEQFEDSTAALQGKYDASVADYSVLQREMDESKRKYRYECDERLSDLRGKLEEARGAVGVVDSAESASVADLATTRKELDKVNRERNKQWDQMRSIIQERAEFERKERAARGETLDARARCKVEVTDLESQLFMSKRREEQMVAQHEKRVSELRQLLDQSRSEGGVRSASGQEEVELLRRQAAAMDAEMGERMESHHRLVESLKAQMINTAEKLGTRVGELENMMHDVEQEERKKGFRLSRLEPEMEDLRNDLQESERSRMTLENRVKKEFDDHASTMDEYAKVMVELKDARAKLKEAEDRCGSAKEEL